MRLLLLFLLMTCLLHAPETRAYQPLLRHYTVRDGLASDVTYDVYQDRKGFVWISTDQGVSRFDGTEFRNYTSQDGLPDNEVFWVREDGFGRCWLRCFNHKPCYIRQGKVYNSSNDSLCLQLERERIDYDWLVPGEQNDWYLTGMQVVRITEGHHLTPRFGKIFSPYSTHYIIYKGKDYCTWGDQLIPMPDNRPANPPPHSLLTGHLLRVDSMFYCFMYNSPGYLGMHEWTITAGKPRKMGEAPVPAKIHNISLQPDGNVLCCSEAGLVVYDTRRHRFFKDSLTLPPGIVPNAFLKDSEGNKWFSTLHDGVYFRQSGSPLVINRASGLSNENVLNLSRWGDSLIIAGGDQGTINFIGPKTIRHLAIVEKGIPNRILQVSPGNGKLMVSCDLGLYLISMHSSAHPKIVSLIASKGHILRRSPLGKAPDAFQGAPENEAAVIVDASCNGVLEHNRTTGHTKYVLEPRATNITQATDGTIWAGSLNGLYYATDSIFRLYSHPVLSKVRITSLAVMPQGYVVVGTGSHGIFLIGRKDQPAVCIDRAHGLSGNICKRVFADRDSTLWVLTSGLDHVVVGADRKVTIHPQILPDGLFGNRINDVTLIRDQVYLATSNGIVITGKNQPVSHTPPVYILSVNDSEINYGSTAHLTLPYGKNALKVTYGAVSLSSGRELVYRYILKGSSGDTVYTKERSINFSALRPGTYELLIWAGFPTGMRPQQPASLRFRVLPPWWQHPGFIVPGTLLLLLLLLLLYLRNIRVVQRRSALAASNQRRLAELELKALRAQINPHFIFNALSSIQSYYSRHDEISANYYMTSFARFMRKTLANSQAQWVSLTEEVQMLKTYIELEQMRFKQLFTYDILIDEGIAADELELPAMLIQPYVENAINHGFRHLGKKGKGELLIRFRLENDRLCCIVEDNGVGIEQAMRLRSEGHQSFGMHLNRQRIECINQFYNKEIDVVIKDRAATSSSTGTIIEIIIPLKTK